MTDIPAEALGVVTDEEAETPPGRLRPEFWQARSALATIRTMADSTMVSAEGLLAAVLANVATYVPQAVWLPRLPRYGTVDLFVCVVGQPGDMKGGLLDLASELLPPKHDTIEQTLGSAQGVIKTFFDRNPDRDDRGHPWLLHDHPVLVRVDEVSTFAGLTDRHSGGDLLLSTMKQAFSGEALGFNYAADDRRYRVPARRYRFVGLLGAAPDKAASLFADQGGGMPERLLFVPATASGLPPLDALPEPPGPIEWTPPTFPGMGPGGVRLFTYDPAIAEEVHRRQYERRTGQVEVGPLDVHGDLQRLKWAAPIAVLDGRYHLSREDWALAAEVMTVHRCTRTALIERLRLVGREAARLAVAHHSEREVAADVARERRQIVDCARRIAEVVRRQPGISVKRLRNFHLTKRQRDVYEAGLAHAAAEGWVVEVEEPGQGEARRVLLPGEGRRT